jgi:hypothetical protein
VGDTVVVEPTQEDDFEKFIGKVTKVITETMDGEPRRTLLLVDNTEVGSKHDEWECELVYPHQCRLAETLDFL